MSHSQLVHCEGVVQITSAIHLHNNNLITQRTRESGALESHSYYNQQIDGDRDQNKPVRESFRSSLSVSFFAETPSSSACEPVRNRKANTQKIT